MELPYCSEKVVLTPCTSFFRTFTLNESFLSQMDSWHVHVAISESALKQTMLIENVHGAIECLFTFFVTL